MSDLDNWLNQLDYLTSPNAETLSDAARLTSLIRVSDKIRYLVQEVRAELATALKSKAELQAAIKRRDNFLIEKRLYTELFPNTIDPSLGIYNGVEK